MKRGTILGLNATQRISRARWLARQITFGQLRVDNPDIVRPYNISGYPKAQHAIEQDISYCQNIFYRLKNYNGGKDPLAIDCADRWRREGSRQLNVTSDCIGGAAWIGGFDRLQVDFPYWGGWINCNSIIADLNGKQCFFRLLERPTPGCYTVIPSKGSSPGHIGTVLQVPAEWDARAIECWAALLIFDIAGSRPDGANRIRPGGAAVFYRRGGMFCEPIMARNI